MTDLGRGKLELQPNARIKGPAPKVKRSFLCFKEMFILGKNPKLLFNQMGLWAAQRATWF